MATATSSDRDSSTTTDVLPHPAARLVSLDAYRGATMLLMASGGLGIGELVERRYAGQPFWDWIAYQVEHVEWTGCSLWDLIQPSFMFMVGVAVPYSLAKRRQSGESSLMLFLHALIRAVILVLLAVFLSSAWSESTEWVFPNVLAQIGLGYPFLFLLAWTRPRTQLVAALAILFGYWLWFALYPLPDANTDWKAIGLPSGPHLSGFAAHWEKGTNAAAAFDRWFLNLFPRKSLFLYNEGGYQTLNFVPSLATMIFGLLTGEMLRLPRTHVDKLRWLLIAGAVGIGAGLFLSAMGVCPIVKRIWTPSWALFSSGCVAWILALFVAVIDWKGFRAWTFPLVVVGANPITIYCLYQLSSSFIRESLSIHLGADIFSTLGPDFVPVLERVGVLFVLWLIAVWMYWQRIFVRI